MKGKFLLPLVILVVMLAGCSPNDTNLLKEELVTPTALPTNTPVPEEDTERSLYDDFSVADPAWLDTYVVTTSAGNDSMISKVELKGGNLVFDIQEAETYLYKFYKNPARPDVVIEASVEGNGAQVNGMALVCRAKNDYSGWYEFRVSDEARYFVYRYDQALKTDEKNPYIELASGKFSKDVFTPFDANTLRMTCEGNTISVEVNGNLITELEDYALPESGMVGLGGMSHNMLPVIVNFDYLSYGSRK